MSRSSAAVESSRPVERELRVLGERLGVRRNAPLGIRCPARRGLVAQGASGWMRTAFA
jgi:hypothetical protein